MTSSSELATARTAAISSARSSSAGGVDGQVEAEAEQLALAAGEPVGQLAGITRGGFSVWVIELPAVRAGAAPRFQAGPLAAQPVGCRGWGDWVDVQGDVEAAGVGQQRLQPAGGDVGGVPGDRQGRGVVVADPQVPGGDLHVRWPRHQVRGGPGRGGAGAAAQRAGQVHGRIPGLVTRWPGTASRLAWMSGAGVSRGGEQGGDLAAVQHADRQVRRGEQPGCLSGALRCACPPPRCGPRPGRCGGVRG